MKYLAHISEDGTREQTLEEHGNNVALLAGEFAESFEARSWGRCAGIMHDVGKASVEFMERLHGGPKVDHATAGAQELMRRNNLYGLLAYCVAGHHSGLPDGGSAADMPGKGTLCGRNKKKVPDYHAYAETLDVPDLLRPHIRPVGEGQFSVPFFLRMVFSCLVDADYLDTELFMKNGVSFRQPGRIGRNHLEAMQRYCEEKNWLKESDRNTVNGRRTEILKAAFQMGDEAPGLFYMTVPTGGGKTTASLAFALSHADKYKKDRIIYVIPYTGIIEQNAQVFRDILGADQVLENHSNISYEDSEELNPMQLAAENWDKPVIVTTNVQFFESLYANRPGKCRKLHNLANSVIIFDEVQKLPTEYLLPCVRAMEELMTNYRSTLVLCTATQPSLEHFFSQLPGGREICPDPGGQFAFFRRTQIRSLGSLSEEELVRRLQSENQALCIPNNRKRVQRLFQKLQGEGVYHLSTLMYPEHRKRVLREIRIRLRQQQRCIVLSTSLVEAGVDVDFQSVYREIAGVDSLVQAAGRCNREGKREAETCMTWIFAFEDGDGLPDEMGQPIEVAKAIAEKYEDLSDPEAIREYYDRLYYIKEKMGTIDKKHIVERLGQKGSIPFAEISRDFRLIEQETKQILIGREQEAKDLILRLQRGEYSRDLLRKLGNYSVQVYEKDFECLLASGCLKLENAWGNEISILKEEESYSEQMGLLLNVSYGNAVIW